MFGLGLFMTVTQAQSVFRLSYQIGVPMGETRDFIDASAFKGMSFEYYHEVGREDLFLGVEAGWNFFHKTYDRETYDFDVGAVTIKQWRYKHVIPVTMNLLYEFADVGNVHFYGKYGLGVYWVNDEVWAGFLEVDSDKALFGMVPGIGFTVEPSDFVGFNVAAEYQFIVNGQARLNDRTHAQYWNFKVGINFHRKSEFVR